MSGKKKKIVVVIASMEVEYARRVLRGIEQEAQNTNTDLYIFNANVNGDENAMYNAMYNAGEYNIFRLIDFKHFDGAVLFANLIQSQTVHDRLIGELRQSCIPVVSVDAEIDGFHFVGDDNYAPLKEIVSHLIEEHGYRKINYISGQDFNFDSQERLRAYCDAMREHGLPVEEKRIFKGTFSNIHGRTSAEKMLEFPELMPEAIVCATDWIAMGVRSVLNEREIEIPRQIALTGFDDTFDGRNSIPSLTTVSKQQEEVGSYAIKVLLDEKSKYKQTTCKRFSSKAIYRESCGCGVEKKIDELSLSRRYMDTINHYERHLFDYSMMMEDLNDCSTFDDFKASMQKYVEELMCQRFYLCLDDSLVADMQENDSGEIEKELYEEYRREGFPDKMAVAMAVEQGQTVTYGEIKTADLFPKATAEDDVSHVFIFSAIHFGDRSMGYMVTDNSEFAMNSHLYYSWVINLSNGLENMRKQCHQKKIVEQLRKMYVTDPLTHLYNRLGFDRFTQESYGHCVKKKKSFMILFADLDCLKQINDQYGHDSGDEAIVTVANALRKAGCHGEVCARFGGDEFLVYAQDYSIEMAEQFCTRLTRALREENEGGRRPYQVGISYGYQVEIPDADRPLNYYVERADHVMYSYKRKKK